MISRNYLILIVCFTLAINSQCKQSEKNTIKDVDGNIYNTALIGDYWWMTENLKSTRFNDGSNISCVKDQSIWLRLDSSAYCYYQNNIHYQDTPGFLYNWYAVNSGKLCPTGWRVPADKDWILIEGTADTKYNANDSIWNKLGLRGFDSGQRLKSVKGWRKGIRESGLNKKLESFNIAMKHIQNVRIHFPPGFNSSSVTMSTLELETNLNANISK